MNKEIKHKGEKINYKQNKNEIEKIIKVINSIDKK